MTGGSISTERRGAAERLLDLVLSSGAHLWHNRPGIDIGGIWHAATNSARQRGLTAVGTPVRPGLHVPAALNLYGQLLEIYELDPHLFARFASYAQAETDWRDLKVATCALLLVQPRSGQPVRDDDGTIAFHDDDYRAVGEAMILQYAKGSTRMMNPKMVLRVAQLLELPDIVELNRAAGFADVASRKAPIGRWRSAVRQWLGFRERNVPLLEGLVGSGFKDTIKQLVRKSAYKPDSEEFFAILGWKQKQSEGGHRGLGLDGLALRKHQRFDGMTERQICERIVAERLTYKDAVGRLPAGTGLTPAIMAALLPTLSDRDLRILTPTLEALGLLADPEIKMRWERALQTATDQRSLNIARNVRDRDLREQLESAAASATERAVNEAVGDVPVTVMFLVDKSGSMEIAIEQSKEALVRILAGFPRENLHVATFDTTGRVLQLRSSTRAGVQHALSDVKAWGGTVHASALDALQRERVRVAAGHRLIVIVVGDEAGEDGTTFARAFGHCGYDPSALALIVSVSNPTQRGRTVREAAAVLQVPFSEVDVAQFADPYQVTRVLKAILEAPIPAGGGRWTVGWLDKVLGTPILEKPAWSL